MGIKEETRKCGAKSKGGETKRVKSEIKSRMLQKTVLSCWGIPQKEDEREMVTAVCVREHVRSVKTSVTVVSDKNKGRVSGAKQLEETEAEFESRKCASAMEVKQLFDYAEWTRK